MSLKRELSLFDAVLLIVGNVIGAGIFTTSGFLAGELPDPYYFIGIWIIGGLLTICGALTYAELAALFPLAGGDYQYLKAAYGRWAGFLLGWTSFWIIGPGSSAALAIALVSYLQGLLHLSGMPEHKLLAIGLIIAFTLVNIRGVRPGKTAQDLITFGALLLLVLMIIAGLLAGNGSWHNFALADSGQSGSWRTMFGTPMIAVLFTYSGWFASAYLGSEIHNPERNLPRSLIIGTLIVSVIYTLMNVLYLYALPLPALQGSVNVAQTAVAQLFNPYLAGLVALPIVLAIAASMNATILTGARVCYAMADDRIFWSACRKLHPTYNTPYVAILSQSAIAILLVSLGSFEQLLGYVVFIMILSSLATGAALFVIRWRNPDLPRPYRTWGYPTVPLLFICSYGVIAAHIVKANPLTSLVGMAIALTGLPFFYRWHRVQPTAAGSQ
jgi:basic amino acid/polyamine antiporter, APA family